MLSLRSNTRNELRFSSAMFTAGRNLSSRAGLRFVSAPDKRPAHAMAGQFPHASAAGVEISGDIGIDHIGLAARGRGLDRVAEIAGAIDARTVDAAGSR